MHAGLAPLTDSVGDGEGADPDSAKSAACSEPCSEQFNQFDDLLNEGS